MMAALVVSDRLMDRLPEVRGRYEEDVSLARITWFRVGGPAEIVLYPAEVDDLAAFLRQRPAGVAVSVIGAGSNLLVRDGGVPGVVVRLSKGFTEIGVEDGDLVVGAGTMDVNVARAAERAGVAGLEFLSGIPGTIGGALRMNGGAYGREMADVTVSATALDRDGRRHVLSREDLRFGYRRSGVPANWIFTAARLRGSRGSRGDIARAQFYLDVRYEGGSHGGTGASEPDLVLTDNQALIAASQTGSNESLAYMGELSVLLQWHVEDPVDEFERRRNDVVYSYQGNRNPFVDHPEWVGCIYGITCAPGSNANDGAWINEIHYDNAGADVDEGVEIAGPAGLSLTGWLLIAYNGSTGLRYDTVLLSGVLPDQESGFGTLWFTILGLQNGSPDGLALIDDAGEVVEFLSYEGSFTAGDGPAAGQTSTEIPVVEPNDTPIGLSLQLQGIGNSSADFIWASGVPHTRGTVNAGQTFLPDTGDGIPAGSTWGMVVVMLSILTIGTVAFRRTRRSRSEL